MSYSYLDQEFANSLLETTVSVLPITPIILLVVDDHALVRAAISQALSPQPEVKLVATAQDYPHRASLFLA